MSELVDARGRKYLTGPERERFLAAARSHPKPAVQRLGIRTQLIMCFLRDMSAESAMAALDESLPYKDWIVGVGLDSDENGKRDGGFVLPSSLGAVPPATMICAHRPRLEAGESRIATPAGVSARAAAAARARDQATPRRSRPRRGDLRRRASKHGWPARTSRRRAARQSSGSPRQAG